MDEHRTVVGDRSRRFAAAKRWTIKKGTDFTRDLLAGLVASVALIANIVSFGALMFPGELSAGIPIVIWAMLLGSCVGGFCIAWLTSLPPLSTGIDSPTGIVLVLLSSEVAFRVLLVGGSPETAIQIVMLIFSITTLLSGLILYALGVWRLGPYFRFVPYFVVGGFLAATGWFLVAGGVRLTTGRMLTFSGLTQNWSMVEIAKLGLALLTLAVLLLLRRWTKSPFALPIALLLMWAAGALGLLALGLSHPADGWYFRSMGSLHSWSPFVTLQTTNFDWPTAVWFLPEMIAVTIVALISLVTKVSSIEVARQVSGNLDQELRAHGLAGILAAPVGGLLSSLQIGTSRLLEQAGSASRMSGVLCSLAIGMVGLASFDLPGLIPIPIVAGLIFFLGYTFIIDALLRPFSQRAWLDVLLAVGIMMVCVRYGYLTGIIVGVVCACLLFAINYARVGIVRRHVTRAQFTSNVDRSQEASEYLRKTGAAIQIYWLSGYIFFGSSEAVFERIRSDIESLPPNSVAHVILDFGLVPGADSSAVISLTKLRNYCEKKGIALVYCALAATNRFTLARAGFFGETSKHRLFNDLNHALAWCENQLLEDSNLDSDFSVAGFERWLQRQLGTQVSAVDLLAYFERKDINGSQVIYEKGEIADTVDFVATGNLAIDIIKNRGEMLRVRHILTHTVVGEMGFFRQSARSATVSSDGPVTLYSLTRAQFERMQKERPDLSSAFYNYIIRALADRIEFSNHVITALST